MFLDKSTQTNELFLFWKGERFGFAINNFFFEIYLLTNYEKNDRIVKRLFAGVAQLVEQLIRNQQVTGSSPVTSSIEKREPVSLFFFF